MLSTQTLHCPHRSMLCNTGTTTWSACCCYWRSWAWQTLPVWCTPTPGCWGCGEAPLHVLLVGPFRPATSHISVCGPPHTSIGTRHQLRLVDVVIGSSFLGCTQKSGLDYPALGTPFNNFATLCNFLFVSGLDVEVLRLLLSDAPVSCARSEDVTAKVAFLCDLGLDSCRLGQLFQSQPRFIYPSLATMQAKVRSTP